MAIDDSPDTKIRQAETLITQARECHRQARDLLREAGVPYIANLTQCADLLMVDAVKLAKAVAFDLEDDDAVTDDVPTNPAMRVA